MELPAGRPARRAVELLRLLGATCEIRTHRERRFQSGQRVEISCAGDDRTLEVLVGAGILSASHAPVAQPPAQLLARAHCRGAYLRGAFLAAGTVAPPRRPAHLEIRTHDAAAAAFLARVAARDEIALRVRERPSHAAVYTKRLATLEDLLAHIGASDGMLRLVEGEVVSAARQDANRQANAETANLRRQVVAARRQLSAIGLLDVDCAAAGAGRGGGAADRAPGAAAGGAGRARRPLEGDAGRSPAAAGGARRRRVRPASRSRYRGGKCAGMLSGGASPSDRVRIQTPFAVELRLAPSPSGRAMASA